jgi:phosphate transport system permease protein
VSATTASPSPSRPVRRLGEARPRYGERVVKGLLFLCAAVSVATTAGIVVALAGPTIEFFGEVPIGDFLFGSDWRPLFSPADFGVLPLVSATIVVTACALGVCIPFGLGAAIYLSEYARPGVRKALKPVLEVLAGIPTVVYGFFALTFVTPALQSIWLFGEPPNVFNALSARSCWRSRARSARR